MPQAARDFPRLHQLVFSPRFATGGDDNHGHQAHHNEDRTQGILESPTAANKVVATSATQVVVKAEQGHIVWIFN